MNWTTKQAAEHFKKMGVSDPIAAACGAPKEHKYHAEKCEVDGIIFDSKREAHHYKTLKIAESVGAISDLKLQTAFVLQDKMRLPSGRMQRPIVYRADFEFVREGVRVIVDVKGLETPVFKMKRKMFALKYPELTLEVWK